MDMNDEELSLLRQDARTLIDNRPDSLGDIGRTLLAMVDIVAGVPDLVAELLDARRVLRETAKPKIEW